MFAIPHVWWFRRYCFCHKSQFLPLLQFSKGQAPEQWLGSLFGMVHALFFKGGESKPFQTFEVKNMAKSKPFKSYLFIKSPFRMLVAPEVSSGFRRRRIDKALGRTTANGAGWTLGITDLPPGCFWKWVMSEREIKGPW